MAYWLSNSFWHSIICFLIPLFVSISIVTPNGQDLGLYASGLYVYTAVVLVCSGKVLLMTRTHNLVTIMSVAVSVLIWFIWLLVFSYIIIQPSDLTVWAIGYSVLPLPNWWLTSVLTAVAALARDLAWRSAKDSFTTNQVVTANYIAKHNLWEELATARQEAAARANARAKGTTDSRRQSNTASLRKANSGVGFAFAAAERDSSQLTDWEQRVRQILYKDKKRKANRKSKKISGDNS